MPRAKSGTLVANTVSYTLSPVPHRVLDVRYISTNRLPMYEMSRSEYYDLPNTTSTGSPHSWYADYQRDSTVLYIWQPLAAVTTETLTYTYFRKFQDIDSLDNDLDVRPEWLEVVGYNLAKRLGPDFGRVGSASFGKIEEEAERLLQEMLDDDREDFFMFVPDGREAYV